MSDFAIHLTAEIIGERPFRPPPKAVAKRSFDKSGSLATLAAKRWHSAISADRSVPFVVEVMPDDIDRADNVCLAEWIPGAGHAARTSPRPHAGPFAVVINEDQFGWLSYVRCWRFVQNSSATPVIATAIPMISHRNCPVMKLPPKRLRPCKAQTPHAKACAAIAPS